MFEIFFFMNDNFFLFDYQFYEHKCDEVRGVWEEKKQN
jgi:hypothetical protein